MGVLGFRASGLPASNIHGCLLRLKGSPQSVHEAKPGNQPHTCLRVGGLGFRVWGLGLLGLSYRNILWHSYTMNRFSVFGNICQLEALDLG